MQVMGKLVNLEGFCVILVGDWKIKHSKWFDWVYNRTGYSVQQVASCICMVIRSSELFRITVDYLQCISIGK
jgi:hypothetical protein